MQHRSVTSGAAARLSASVGAFRQSGIDAHVPIDAAALAEMIADSADSGETLIVGVTGSVAAGKTALCTSIANHLRSTLHVETISTDGFLMPNLVLEKLGLSLRKGFPETYDSALMSGTLQRVRLGAVRVPGYCHKLYDRASELDRTINRPDIVLVEGLGLSSGPAQRTPSALVDVLIYIDASEQDLETWFVRRFMGFLREAEINPDSFYNRFRTMAEPDAEKFAHAVWAGINLPNLRDHIAPARDTADIVLRKTLDHALYLQRAARSAAN
jgi:type I pantothenate kinase